MDLKTHLKKTMIQETPVGLLATFNDDRSFECSFAGTVDQLILLQSHFNRAVNRILDTEDKAMGTRVTVQPPEKKKFVDDGKTN